MRAERSVEAIETEAARWLLRREDPSWSPADEAALAAWLAASGSHRVSFIRLKAVWRQAAGLGAAAGDASQAVESSTGMAGPAATRASRRPRRWPRMGRRAGVAAAFALVACGLLAVQLWLPARSSYHTPVGGRAIIPLADGSSITLNTDSAVRLRLDGRERRVDLLRGEAFFEVAPDPRRVFAVHADDRRVVAVGTKFAVRLRPGAVQVAVTEGHVKMEPRSGLIEAAARRVDPDPAAAVPLLAPGDVATVEADGDATVRRQSLAAVERMLGWRGGDILLHRVTLKEAVDEFNRYSQRRLILADPALEGIRVGGNFRADNVDGFVRLLREGFAIRARERDGRIVLDRPPPPRRE